MIIYSIDTTTWDSKITNNIESNKNIGNIIIIFIKRQSVLAASLSFSFFLFFSYLAVSSFPTFASSLILLSLPRLSKGHHIDYAPRNGRLVQRTIMLADARKGKAMRRKSSRFLPASLMPVAAEVSKYNWHRRNRFVTETRSEEETITQRITKRSKLAANEISFAYRTHPRWPKGIFRTFDNCDNLFFLRYEYVTKRLNLYC